MPAIKASEALMRGFQDKQTSLLAMVSIEARIPSDHPLRRIKKMADQELNRLSGVFNRMYSQVGRPSIAPERILKSLLLIALIRSEASGSCASKWATICCFAGFWTWSLRKRASMPRCLARIVIRLMEHEVGRLFFDAVV